MSDLIFTPGDDTAYLPPPYPVSDIYTSHLDYYPGGGSGGEAVGGIFFAFFPPGIVLDADGTVGIKNNAVFTIYNYDSVPDGFMFNLYEFHTTFADWIGSTSSGLNASPFNPVSHIGWVWQFDPGPPLVIRLQFPIGGNHIRGYYFGLSDTAGALDQLFSNTIAIQFA